VSRSAASGSGDVPARPHAWASLPPIQRAAGTMPQVAAPGAFVDRLSGTQGLPPIVEQLGHEVSPMATPGLVVARVRAVEQSSGRSIPAPRRAGRTVQRQAAPDVEPMSTIDPELALTTPVVATPLASATAAPAVTPTSAPPLPAATSGVAQLPLVARSATTAPTADAPDADDELLATGAPAAPIDTAPVRSMPTVSRSAVRVPDRPLTSAASVVRSQVQRSSAGPSTEGGPAASPLPAPSGGMRRAQAGSSLARPTAPTVSREATTATAPTATLPPTPPTVSREEQTATAVTASTVPPSATSSRPAAPAGSASLPSLPIASPRRGIGEPITMPATARPIGAQPPVVSRSTMQGPMPVASTRLRTTVQRTGDGDEETEDESPVAQLSAIGGTPVQRTAAAAAAGVPLPHLPVARTPALDGSTPGTASGRSSRAAETAHVASDSMPVTASTSMPVASTGTGSEAAAVQRTTTATTIRPIAAHNPLRPSLELQRDADEQATDLQDDAALPSPWWAPAPVASAGGPALAGVAALPGHPAPPSTPAVQRATGAGTSPFATPASTAAGPARIAPPVRAPGVAVQRSSSAIRTSTGRLPLASPASPSVPQSLLTPAPAPVSVPNWGAPGTTVTFPAGRGPSVQTSRAPAGSTAASAHTPTVQRSNASTTSADAGGASSSSGSDQGRSERELDELARALFGRIRTRLRSDLLQDREAAGFTFDNV